MMGTAKLLIHAGTHKTGTTAIQQALEANRHWLDGQGILYPDYLPLSGRRFWAHHPMARALARRSPLDRLTLFQFQLRLRNASRGKRCCVLSAESIYRHVVARRPVKTSDDFMAGHREYLGRLARFLKDFEITVLLYLRRPDSLAISLFKERIVLGTALDFSEFVHVKPWLYDYRRRVDLFRQTLGPIETRIYEIERDAGLVSRFFKGLDLPPPAESSTGTVRASPSNRAILWLKRAQQESPRARPGHLRRVLFTRMPESDDLFTEPEPSTLWPSRSCFANFVERQRDAYEFGAFDHAGQPDLAPAEWSDARHHEAEAAFAVWEAKHEGRLEQRERLRLRFFENEDIASQLADR